MLSLLLTDCNLCAKPIEAKQHGDQDDGNEKALIEHTGPIEKSICTALTKFLETQVKQILMKSWPNLGVSKNLGQFPSCPALALLIEAAN